jgi:hypothetical protein
VKKVNNKSHRWDVVAAFAASIALIGPILTFRKQANNRSK